MRVAIIHDWLFGMRGGERCLEAFLALFPKADVYSLFYRPENISLTIRHHQPIQSALGELPWIERYYRFLLPFYPVATKQLGRRLAEAHKKNPYDLVLSISHCAVKNIEVPKNAYHLSYCLTPMRYVWDQYDRYFAGRLLEPVIRQVVKPLRHWDVGGSAGVDQFVSISNFVAKRLERAYRRTSSVIYPPVRTDWIKPRLAGEVGQGFLVVNALVPYKNVRVIVEAFNVLGHPLTIIGSGPEKGKLMAMAKENITFIEHLSDDELAQRYRSAKALIFAAEEDFGMVPVEMQAAGRPVIAFGAGGVLETVKFAAPGASGISFAELNCQNIIESVKDFLDREDDFTVDNCTRQAEKFSFERFQTEITSLLMELVRVDVKEARTAL